MAEDKNKTNKPDNADQVTETPDGTPVIRSVGRDFRVEGNDVDGFVGVSPEYRTYANSTERPYISADDVELLVSHEYPTDVEQMTLQQAAVAQRDADAKGDSEDDKSDSESDKKSTGEKAVTEGQGDKPKDPTSATTQTAGGRAAAGTTTSNK